MKLSRPFNRPGRTANRFQPWSISDLDPMKTHSHTTRSTKLKSYLVSSSVLTALAASSQGAIALIDDPAAFGSFFEGGNVNDGDQATVTIGLPDGTQLFLDPKVGNGYELGSELFVGLSTGGKWAGSGFGVIQGSYYFRSTGLLTAGDFVYGTNIFSSNSLAFLASSSPGYENIAPSLVGNNSGYFGFETVDGHKGWIAVSYDSTTGLFTYNGGAVEMEIGAPLAAGDVGVIPEPSSALLALAGIGGAVLRRRRKNVAAVCDRH